MKITKKNYFKKNIRIKGIKFNLSSFFVIILSENGDAMKKKIIIELIIIVILGIGIFFLYKERDLIKPKKEEE